MSTMEITASNGVRFIVRIVREGDRYGRDGYYVNQPGEKFADGSPQVEFYDARYPQPDWAFAAEGQFVSRYRVDTILGFDEYGSGVGGLDLQGDVADWKIDDVSMRLVRWWLLHETRQEARA